ncbi:MAG: S9 family peptidase [Erysipelotrichaceae bacterium]|nr:S9 family peptidase [Erysipelotrichaceae bacterium]
MKEIKRDLIYKYQPLSNIQLSKDEKKVYFVTTKTDLKNNDYVQDLNVIGTENNKSFVVVKGLKRVNYFVVNEGILLIDSKKQKEGYTCFLWLKDNGKTVKAFDLPLQVDSLQDFNRNYYLVSATTSRSCPDFHKLNGKQQKAYLKEKKKDEDYIVFDEYPFVYNGAGVINGNRTSLFLVSKKGQNILKITNETLDVENFDVKDEKILFSGVDFDTFKGKWSAVYEYDHKTKKTEKLFDDRMEVYRLFYYKDRKIVLGTFGKDWGAIESGKFYSLENGEMVLQIDCEYSFYNAVLSDVRYGKTRSLVKSKDDVYLLTCSRNETIIVRYDGDRLTTVFTDNGTADDFCVKADGTIYAIAMLDMKLEEVYLIKDGKNSCLTSVNRKVLSDKYVAKPEEIVLKKKMPVYGWVLKPINYDPKKKYPAILDIHGGPRCAYGPIYMHEMQVWASEGYFVFFCNPRGSDGRGNAFGDLRGKYGKIDYEDLMDFTDLVLKEYPNIDKERLGVTGGSYGGYMTNWIVGHTDRFKAAASQRSISNWITEVTVSDYGIDFPIEMEFKDVRHCEKELWDISPLKYVNNVKTPILFIHSREDYRCTLPEALQFYTPIRINGIDTKLVIFKGENHELSRNGKPLHRLRRMNEITDWLNKYLKG